MGWSAWLCELVVHSYYIYTRVVYSVGLGLWLGCCFRALCGLEEVVLGGVGGGTCWSGICMEVAGRCQEQKQVVIFRVVE